MPFTSTPISVLDGAAATKPLIAYNDGTNSAFAHPVLDSAGVIISPATVGAQNTGNASLATIATNTTGAATATLQTTGNSSLASIATNTAGGATAALQTTANTKLDSLVSNTTGAATSANQATGNSSLAAIATNTTGGATATLQGTGNTSLTAISTSTGNVDTSLGAKADAAATTDTGTFGLIALLKRGLQSLTSLVGNTTNADVLTYAATGGTGNALLTATAVAIKASAGSLCGVNFVNTGAADAYVQLFNVAVGSVTLGTTVPKMTFWVPAAGAWEQEFIGDAKVLFGTAITVAAATTPTGSTAPGTGVLANIVYK